uniref:Transcriptional adapter 2B n=1 Tax=Cacopsylla melanoneura TaxID=428564 RepID=A0A8D8PXQ3_9HEMI
MSSVPFSETPAKNSCTYCQDLITGLRIKCMECPNFDICLQCFAAGAEIGPHKNDHDYKFVDTVSVVFGSRGWRAQELIDLLNAVEYRGFGNWEDIAKEIKTRTADEAREEYISRFLEGTIGKVTWEDSLKSNQVKIIDMTDQLSEGPLATLPRGGGQIHIAQEKANQIGYMPLRDDFEWEYENNAESVVSGLIHLEDDTDVDTTLKLVHVDMYINKLRERARRKRVVKDFQLIPKFFNSQLNPAETKTVKRKLNKDDSPENYATSLEHQLRKFSQFHTALEHSQFLDNLVREHRLRRRLAELYRYRMNGIKTIQDCEVFDELSPDGAGSNSASGSSKTTQSVSNTLYLWHS